MMGKLVVSEFVTLDGVMEDPGGAEGFDRGGWAFRFERGPEGDRFKLDEVLEADALLLGRRTYEGFAEAWPSRTDEAGFADKMNAMRKYVVSTTLETAGWNNSTLIGGDVATEVAKLKDQAGGDILVAGSRTLVQTLLRHDLVDELRLMVFPVALGSGKRLFPDAAEMTTFELVETRPAGAVAILVLRREATA
jgi:dihydrofolate reductase